MMHSPIQNAEKLPVTKPDKIFNDAPPCLEQLVTSRTCREFVLKKIFVNAEMIAPATVPQLMMIDNTHHRSGWATFLICVAPASTTSVGTAKSPSNSLL